MLFRRVTCEISVRTDHTDRTGQPVECPCVRKWRSKWRNRRKWRSKHHQQRPLHDLQIRLRFQLAKTDHPKTWLFWKRTKLARRPCPTSCCVSPTHTIWQLGFRWRANGNLADIQLTSTNSWLIRNWRNTMCWGIISDLTNKNSTSSCRSTQSKFFESFFESKRKTAKKAAKSNLTQREIRISQKYQSSLTGHNTTSKRSTRRA